MRCGWISNSWFIIPIDGVGHQGFSLVNTLSVLSPSSFSDHHAVKTCLSSRLFLLRSFLFSTSCSPLCQYSTRIGYHCLHYFSKCICALFYVCGKFPPKYLYPRRQTKLTCILEFLQSANAKYLILNSTPYIFVFNNYSVKTAMLQLSILN